MQPMTGVERILNITRRQPVDRIGLYEHFWSDTRRAWLEQGPLEEDEETILTRDGNGALLRRHKLHDATPEHVDFWVKDRSGWEEYVRPKLTPDPRRIDFEGVSQGQGRCPSRESLLCLIRDQCI